MKPYIKDIRANQNIPQADHHFSDNEIRMVANALEIKKF